MVEERDAARAQEAPLQKQLDGLAREKGAVLEYLAQLEREAAEEGGSPNALMMMVMVHCSTYRAQYPRIREFAYSRAPPRALT